MSARAVAVALLAAFFIVALQVTLAGPLTTVAEDINATGDYSDVGGQDGNAIITDLVDEWFTMGIIAFFGILAWAAWRVLRRELTRGGGL